MPKKTIQFNKSVKKKEKIKKSKKYKSRSKQTKKRKYRKKKLKKMRGGATSNFTTVLKLGDSFLSELYEQLEKHTKSNKFFYNRERINGYIITFENDKLLFVKESEDNFSFYFIAYYGLEKWLSKANHISISRMIDFENRSYFCPFKITFNSSGKFSRSECINIKEKNLSTCSSSGNSPGKATIKTKKNYDEDTKADEHHFEFTGTNIEFNTVQIEKKYSNVEIKIIQEGTGIKYIMDLYEKTINLKLGELFLYDLYEKLETHTVLSKKFFLYKGKNINGYIITFENDKLLFVKEETDDETDDDEFSFYFIAYQSLVEGNYSSSIANPNSLRTQSYFIPFKITFNSEGKYLRSECIPENYISDDKAFIQTKKTKADKNPGKYYFIFNEKDIKFNEVEIKNEYYGVRILQEGPGYEMDLYDTDHEY